MTNGDHGCTMILFNNMRENWSSLFTSTIQQKSNTKFSCFLFLFLELDDITVSGQYQYFIKFQAEINKKICFRVALYINPKSLLSKKQKTNTFVVIL